MNDAYDNARADKLALARAMREMVLDEVYAERERQHARFGPQDHLSAADWLVVLMEEVGGGLARSV